MKKEKQKTREEELKEGCGFQETYSKGSLCLRGNLCSDCQENLDCFEEGKQSALKQFEEEVKEKVGNMIIPIVD